MQTTCILTEIVAIQKLDIDIEPMSHKSGVLTAFPQRPQKLQIAKVNAVQSPVTLCAHCAIA